MAKLEAEKVIWKYQIPVDDQTHIFSIPGGSQAVPVHCECTSPQVVTLWLMLPPNEPSELCRFTVVGTGMKFPYSWIHLGSCRDGVFVWHLLEKIGDD